MQTIPFNSLQDLAEAIKNGRQPNGEACIYVVQKVTGKRKKKRAYTVYFELPEALEPNELVIFSGLSSSEIYYHITQIASPYATARHFPQTKA